MFGFLLFPRGIGMMEEHLIEFAQQEAFILPLIGKWDTHRCIYCMADGDESAEWRENKETMTRSLEESGESDSKV